MPNKFIFADEAGCFTFNRDPNVSKFFILCTVLMDDCSVGTSLLNLRRDLAWKGGFELGEYFHATTEKQAVRDEVFRVIMSHDFTVQATVMEKCKAQPQVKESKARCYKYAYYFHFKYGIIPLLNKQSEALVTTASLGQRKERVAFQSAVSDVMNQTKRAKEWKADFMPCHADPCLQVADYCAWAIQRKWESNGKDVRSYDIIKNRILYEYDLFKPGTKQYY
jgi:hypothetical protein